MKNKATLSADKFMDKLHKAYNSSENKMLVHSELTSLFETD